MTPHRQTIDAHNKPAADRALFADAAQLDLQDIGVYIRAVRNARSDENRAYAANEYRRHVFMLAGIQEIAARHGWTDPVFQPQAPIPFREQLVGISDAERREIEWKPYQ